MGVRGRELCRDKVKPENTNGELLGGKGMTFLWWGIPGGWLLE